MLELPPNTESVPTARRFVRDLMVESDTVADVDTASLLVTEIVTNAVLHAWTPMTLRVSRSAPTSCASRCRDGSQLPPRVHAFSATAATGRGLRLLESLAVRWGVRPEPAAARSCGSRSGRRRRRPGRLAAEDWLGEVVPGDF